MEKEKKVLDIPKIILSILEIIALILAISFVYFSVKGRDYTDVYSQKVQGKTVESLIIALKLYNLHEIPYTAITPKIQIYIKEDMYYVNAYYIEIVKGEVIIKDGESDKKDIIIRTTKEEVLKIVEDNNYTKESLSSGKISIEKVESDFVLFAKGYSSLYREFNQ